MMMHIIMKFSCLALFLFGVAKADNQRNRRRLGRLSFLKEKWQRARNSVSNKIQNFKEKMARKSSVTHRNSSHFVGRLSVVNHNGREENYEELLRAGVRAQKITSRRNDSSDSMQMPLNLHLSDNSAEVKQLMEEINVKPTGTLIQPVTPTPVVREQNSISFLKTFIEQMENDPLAALWKSRFSPREHVRQWEELVNDWHNEIFTNEIMTEEKMTDIYDQLIGNPDLMRNCYAMHKIMQLTFVGETYTYILNEEDGRIFSSWGGLGKTVYFLKKDCLTAMRAILLLSEMIEHKEPLTTKRIKEYMQNKGICNQDGEELPFTIFDQRKSQYQLTLHALTWFSNKDNICEQPTEQYK